MEEIMDGLFVNKEVLRVIRGKAEVASAQIKTSFDKMDYCYRLCTILNDMVNFLSDEELNKVDFIENNENDKFLMKMINFQRLLNEVSDKCKISERNPTISDTLSEIQNMILGYNQHYSS